MLFKTMSKFLGFFAAFVLLNLPVLAVACGAHDVEYKEAYVQAVAAAPGAAAGYVTIVNETDKPLRLMKVTSPAAEQVVLHRMMHADGAMRMVILPALEIDPHSTTVFAPGGMHLMLMGLKQPLSAGDTVDFSFQYEDGSVRHVNGVPVR